MDTLSPSLLELARQLWVASLRVSDPHATGPSLVNANLQRSLIQFAGSAGFQSLLRRAITLATVEAPVLRTATISPDGRVQGIEQLIEDAASAKQAGVAVMAHMLGLLMTFIGEPLTRSLVLEACPEASQGD